MNYVIFLQNAWSPLYAGGTWPRASWLKALEKSRSGKMVKILTDDLDRVDNTTPIVGDTASSKISPDWGHMEMVIDLKKPDFIVACGQQAMLAVETMWKGDFICLPHPACRWLPTDLYQRARGVIDSYDAVRKHWRRVSNNGKYIKTTIWQQKGGPITIDHKYRD